MVLVIYPAKGQEETEAQMRVSREKAAENRERIVEIASQMFREKGFDGISIDSIMRGAGLTHGGFYAHFGSKDDLAAEAVTRALERSVELQSRFTNLRRTRVRLSVRAASHRPGEWLYGRSAGRRHGTPGQRRSPGTDCVLARTAGSLCPPAEGRHSSEPTQMCNHDPRRNCRRVDARSGRRRSRPVKRILAAAREAFGR